MRTQHCTTLTRKGVFKSNGSRHDQRMLVPALEANTIKI